MKKSDARNSKKAKQRHELASLKEENRILRAEVKRLNRALRVCSSGNPSVKERDKEKSREVKLLEGKKRTSVALASSSYFKYLFARFSAASIYHFIKKVTKGFRRFRLFSSVLRITSYVLALLGTSAVFIFISGTLIFFIPLFILIGASAYLASMLFRKRAFRELDQKLEEKTLFVLLPSAGRPFEKGSILEKSLDIILRETNQDGFIIIVSPFLISERGFGGKGYFPVMRTERENVCIIRRNAFFAMRRKLLGKRSERVIYIY